MGYTTEFEGYFTFNSELDSSIITFINQFSSTRRMKRKVDPKYGIEGEYYCISIQDFGQNNESNIIDYNDNPCTQPSLWSNWIINNNQLQWNGGEKFYNYIDWLIYYINNFFEPYNYKLNGTIFWRGEDEEDLGTIIAKNSVLYIVEPKILEDKFIDEIDKMTEAMLVLSDIKCEIYYPKSINKRLDFEDLLKGTR